MALCARLRSSLCALCAPPRACAQRTSAMQCSAGMPAFVIRSTHPSRAASFTCSYVLVRCPQSFCAAFEEQLSEYYRLLAILDAQVRSSPSALDTRLVACVAHWRVHCACACACALSTRTCFLSISRQINAQVDATAATGPNSGAGGSPVLSTAGASRLQALQYSTPQTPSSSGGALVPVAAGRSQPLVCTADARSPSTALVASSEQAAAAVRERMTLRRLFMRLYDPLHRLKLLALLFDLCKGTHIARTRGFALLLLALHNYSACGLWGPCVHKGLWPVQTFGRAIAPLISRPLAQPAPSPEIFTQ